LGTSQPPLHRRGEAAGAVSSRFGGPAYTPAPARRAASRAVGTSSGARSLVQSLNGKAPASAARPSSLRSPRVWIGVPISLLFLVLAFRGQQPDEIRDALSRVDWRTLPLALILLYTGVAVRAYRWHVLLRPVRDIPTREVFPIMIIGYAANNILPLRAGELVRAWTLEQRYGVRKTAALATIAVERLFDGVTMLLFVGGAATVIGLNAELQHVALVAAAVFAVAIAGLVILLAGGSVRDRLLRLVLGPLPAPLAARIERMAESFLAGLGVLSRRRDLALVAMTSVAAWGFETSMYWTVARAFGDPLAGAMTPAAALLTTAIANLATLVPSGPGYVGTFEAGVLLAVNGALGIGRGLALSYAVLLHILLWLPVTVWGAIEWWRLGVSGKRHVSLTHASAEERAAASTVAGGAHPGAGGGG
ncbi:MAG: flippase-like domain-containing protein, partial [Chloroflexota bacterium]|nr:flippase-like domain-containing protein [Chloroflexota bacterium]